jgi:peroxiredoxin Q/BCP
MLRDNIKRFEAKGCVVLGVSMDPPDSHKKFCTEQKLPFDLLADTNKSVHKAFGFEKMVRATFLIDKKGTLVYANRSFQLKDEVWQDLFKAVEALPD